MRIMDAVARWSGGLNAPPLLKNTGSRTVDASAARDASRPPRRVFFSDVEEQKDAPLHRERGREREREREGAVDAADEPTRVCET
jgi:hypothetical protein